MFHVILWGLLAGVVHFFIIGVLYGNPVVDRMYATAMSTHPGVKRWDSKPRYLVAQFLGTQIEVFILTAAFFWLRPFAEQNTILFSTLLAATRVYPRFWNMWIQSTYPGKLLATELVNGTIGTFAIVYFLKAFAT